MQFIKSISFLILFLIFIISCKKSNDCDNLNRSNKIEILNQDSGNNKQKECNNITIDIFKKEEYIKSNLKEGLYLLDDKYITKVKFYDNNRSGARITTSLLAMGIKSISKDKNQRSLEKQIKIKKEELENLILNKNINWKLIKIKSQSIATLLTSIKNPEWNKIAIYFNKVVNKLPIKKKNIRQSLISNEEKNKLCDKIKKKKTIDKYIKNSIYEIEKEIYGKLIKLGNLSLNYFEFYKEKIKNSFITKKSDYIKIRTYWSLLLNRLRNSFKKNKILISYFENLIKKMDDFLLTIRGTNLNHKLKLKKVEKANRKLRILINENPGIINLFFDFGITEQTKINIAELDLNIKRKLLSIKKRNHNNNYKNWKLIDWYYIYTKLKEVLEKKGIKKAESNNIFKKKLKEADKAVSEYLNFIYNNFEIY